MINRRTVGNHGSKEKSKPFGRHNILKNFLIALAVIAVSYAAVTACFSLLGGRFSLNPCVALDPKEKGLSFNDVFFYIAALLGFAGFLFSLIFTSVNTHISSWLNCYGCFLKEIADFLAKRKVLVFIIVLLTVVTYGFEVTNSILSIDEEIKLYAKQDSEGWATEGRFGIGVFKRVFMVFGMFPPFVADFLAVVILAFSGIVAMFLINKALSRSNLSTFENAVFFGFYISFPPVLVEYLSFATYSIEVSFAIYLAISCVYFVHVYMQSRKVPPLLWAALSLIASVSVYQALATVFLTMLIIFLVCSTISEDDFSAKAFFRMIGKVIVIAFGCLLVYLCMYMLARILQTSADSDAYLAAMTGWSAGDGVVSAFVSSIKALGHLLLDNNKIPGMSCFMISIIMLLASAVISVATNRGVRRVLVPILICLVAVAPFFLWIVLASTSMPLRTLLGFPLASAFAALLLLRSIKPFVRLRYMYWLLCCVMVVLLFNQIQDVNRLFYSDSVRSNADVRLAQNIANDIEHEIGGDIDRPVVIIGSHDTAKDDSTIIKNPNTNLHFGGDALGYSLWRRTGEPVRMHGLFLYAGYDLKFETPTKDDKELVSEVWPEEGSIVVEDDRVLVRISEKG